MCTPAAITQFLDDLPSGSDASSSSEDDVDEEDFDYIALKRDRGEEAEPVPDSGMFRHEVPDDDYDDNKIPDDLGCGDGPDDEGEDSTDEELPDIEPVTGEPSKKKTRQERKVWQWARGDLPPQEMPKNTVKPRGMEDCRYSVDYFMKMFGKKNFELLLEQTNIQRARVNKKVPYISMQEIRQTVGILMYMSVVHMPSMRLFWKRSMNFSAISQVMSRDRFFEIVNNLHLSDNERQPEKGARGYDRLYKVRELLTNLNVNFKENADMEEVISVDEQMIPYKGTLGIKVYMKNKPSKWGIKVSWFYKILCFGF